jgi:hypothetical protein
MSEPNAYDTLLGGETVQLSTLIRSPHRTDRCAIRGGDALARTMEVIRITPILFIHSSSMCGDPMPSPALRTTLLFGRDTAQRAKAAKSLICAPIIGL